MSSPCNACQRERTPTSSKKCTHSSRSAPSSRLEMASTGCFFHNRRAIRLSSRRANRQSSRSTRFVVISSLFCMVGPPSGVLPLSEDQPRIKLIPYVGISGNLGLVTRSTRVYLSKNTCQTTQEENIPVCIRIQRSRATVKDLPRRLQHAYQRDDVRLVRRTTVLIDLLVHHVPVAVWCERWGLSPACIYGWQKAFLLRGLDSLVYGQGGGRHPKLSPKQKPRFVELIDAGPLVVGCETACWTSVLIRVLIWREFGVLYNCQDGCTLLRNLGFSFPKARFVSDHLDAARRQPWLQQEWPRILRAAQRHQGLSLFEDEASCAQWGSLSYTWARRGQQPEVKTSGKRQGYKVFGAIESFSGRLFYQGIEGRFNSESHNAPAKRG